MKKPSITQGTAAHKKELKRYKELQVDRSSDPSPAKGKRWESFKRGAEKVYDKASQIGMGVKRAIMADNPG